MTTALDLFQDATAPTRQTMLSEAEDILLRLADVIYTQSSLKPMSKTLFLLSRCLLVVSQEPGVRTATELVRGYDSLRRSLGSAAPADDYSFEETVQQASSHLAFLLESLDRVRALTAGGDSLGMAFDTLLRGKWESGEGLGTYLTPEEVVRPMVTMTMAAMDEVLLARIGQRDDALFFGDICGGTGRFAFHLARGLAARGVPKANIESGAHLYDQSCMAVDLAKLNFVMDGLRPDFRCVHDSLTDEGLSRSRGRYAILATNPPFGSGKYVWSRAVADALSPKLATELGLQGPGTSADPAILFVFRNLDLLAEGGALGIVLPDGILHSPAFHRALIEFEALRGIHLSVAAIVSLPPSAFALGGTVAKTSFAIFKRGGADEMTSLFVATARHIGFKKRGNRRAPDPAGNDLVGIAEEFTSGSAQRGEFIADWRSHRSLAPSALHVSAGAEGHADLASLDELGEPIKRYCAHVVGEGRFHISILDVDETGLIDILAASRNAPVTRSLRCQPGDVLISCLNPKIWRVTMVPDLPGEWTCSSEFLVVRPRKGVAGSALSIALHHTTVRAQIEKIAGGTSSSRQRVPKDEVMKTKVPLRSAEGPSATQLARTRAEFYKMRLREGRAFAALHSGEATFDLL